MSQIIESSLPMVIQKQEQETAINYRIFGNENGAGVKTDNLFDKNAKDTSNGYVPGKYLNSSGSYVTQSGFDVSEYIPVNVGVTYYLYWVIDSTSTVGYCFYDENKHFLSGYKYGSKDGASFTVSSASYIRFSVRTSSSAIYDGIGLYKDAMTVPEPYGYKIPLSLTSGQNTDTYPLYIGSTKLGAEEYVDYASGKILKRTENLFNKDDFILADLSLYNETKITSSTTDCIIVMPCEANTQYVISIPNYDSTVWRIGLSDYEIPASNQEYTRIESEKPSGNVSTFTTLATTKNILLQIQKATVDITKNSIMLVLGSTAPSTYIPYLQPTDPPSPLPSITSYIGENTFNSTEVINKMRIEFNEGFIYDGKYVSQFHINNQFYDLVDSSFYSLIADDFNSLTSYSEGDYCIHNYHLYKCLFATQGDWISECWELISLADLIQGDGQEVGVDDDAWRIIYEICNGTLSDNLVIDYDYIKGGKFAYCDMSTIELPNCTQILPLTFYSCKNLSFISAPNCTSIGNTAFSACDALISYNMPLVQTIDADAFRACITLPLASFSQNLQIGSRAFLGCTSLSEVNMPAVSIIYSDAFSGCTALTTLELPGCLSIYSYGLRNCNKLETASFPNLVRIYSSGFAGCEKLMSLYLLSTKMCTLQNANAFGGTPISVSTGGIYGSIYVPSTLVESYKVATGWVTYANRFVAYQE